MADAVDVAAADDFEHLFNVDFRGSQQHLAQQTVGELWVTFVQIQCVVGHDFTHQAEAVGMNAARRHAHQHVADLDLRAVDQPLLLDHTDREAGDVVLAVGIHTRHFGRLAAHQGATRLAAALRDPGDDSFDFAGLVAPHGHVVEEQQRFGPLRQHVVDAHGHGIDADGIVLVHGERQLELGADAVGAAHQHRLLDPQRREVEHPAERPDIAHHAQTRSRRHVLLDAPHHFVSGFEVDPRLFITFCHRGKE